jgi:hypothetical protein
MSFGVPSSPDRNFGRFRIALSTSEFAMAAASGSASEKTAVCVMPMAGPCP